MRHNPVPEYRVLRALAKGPCSALNLAYRNRWPFVGVVEALASLRGRGEVIRVDGDWRLTAAGSRTAQTVAGGQP